MPIDRQYVGFSMPPYTALVDRERLRRFAEAIGGAIHSDLAPPTYLKVIEGENDSSRAIVAALGIDLRRIMHVEQEFEYRAPLRGGDQVTVERRVVDIYDRKDGALEFVVVESAMHNADGICVGRSKQWILVRNEIRIAPA
jgi:hydroxyacyl-ACP dehydratase HTD2-like protein with hotdog domain